MSKTSQKQEKEDGLHAMAHRLCRLGASQHQWIPAERNQWQGATASWPKCLLGFPGLVSKKCRPALPCLKGCTSCAQSSCVPGGAPQWPRSPGLARTSQPRNLQFLGKHTLPLACSGPPQGHARRPSSGEKFRISLKTVLRPSPTPNKRRVFSPVKSIWKHYLICYNSGTSTALEWSAFTVSFANKVSLEVHTTELIITYL